MARQVPKPLLIAGDDGRSLAPAAFRDGKSGDTYMLFEDPENAQGIIAMPASEAYKLARDAIKEYRSHLRRGFLPQGKDLDESGRGERGALRSFLNLKNQRNLHLRKL